MDENKCKKCGQSGEGYKCDQCGAEAKEHDPEHKPCGGDHCLMKCGSCKEAETKCRC